MRPLPFTIVCSLAAASRARYIHSLPEDTYAFPKFKVSFLNNLPISNHTAQNWLADGLQGGRRQFLDQPWADDSSNADSNTKEITSSDSSSLSADSIPAAATEYSLEHMKMGPRDSYLCYIPKPLDLPPPPSEEVDDNVTPVAHGWSLLQPLSGTCLYHRQLWFTYSYCHNDEIRQFKALPQLQSNGEGGYKPVEDPEWESYSLGKAPPTPQPGSDLTVAEQNALAANLELARGAGSRYLVQRWGDGTICDKTGRPREVEVQFHCSMTMSDNILFVKETKTCSYVLVINTPRLCGVPGFRSRRDVSEQHEIQCREIVQSPEPRSDAFLDVKDTDHPLKIPRTKPTLPPVAEKNSAAKFGDEQTKETLATFLRTFQAILGGEKVKDFSATASKASSQDADGNIVFELVQDLDDVEVLDLKDILTTDEESADITGSADRLAKAFKAAGFEVQTLKAQGASGGQGSTKSKTDESAGEKSKARADNSNQGDERRKSQRKSPPPAPHDEL